MNVLIACEESQRVCIEFRKRGFEAYSCDVVDCSGGHPEWHIKADALPLLNGNCDFVTCDGKRHRIDGKWDLLIAHPPCTYLTNVATRSFSLRCTPAEKVVERWENRAKAAVFFMRFVLAECDRVAVENPIGFMSTAYRKPNQIISPWMFADSTQDKDNYCSKKTCLWLKRLPKLKGNGIFESFDNGKAYGKYSNGKNKSWEDHKVRSAKDRSKTFPGIARAMAEQWGDFLKNESKTDNSGVNACRAVKS